nr:MAG TPA: hypothetical protein [Caudoviricetes sp.]
MGLALIFSLKQARPRGVRLSACGLKLTQLCGLKIPTQ